MRNCIKNMQKSDEILFIISSLGTGGAERVLSELANFFCTKDIKVHILLLSKDYINYEIDESVDVILGCNEIKGKNRISDFVSRIRLIRKYYKQIQPGVTISFLSAINIYSCLALGFSKGKLIVSERNDPQKMPSNMIKRLFRDVVYYLADGYVFQTNEAEGYFSKHIQGKSIVIPNPVKPDLSKPYMGKRTKKIVAVGRLEQQKNYQLLIKAFKLIADDFKEYVVEIYGEGRQHISINKLICELKLSNQVNLMGRHNDVHERIKDAALYVLTSNYEGMPNALMEAMALGLPCISLDCSGGGPRTLIENGINGILVTNSDEYALSQQISNVLNNEILIDNISKNAVLVREKYSIKEIGHKWLNYITKITRSNE